MKKIVVVAAASVAALVAVRRVGPALGERAKAKCHEMMTRMAEKQGAGVGPASR